MMEKIIQYRALCFPLFLFSFFWQFIICFRPRFLWLFLVPPSILNGRSLFDRRSIVNVFETLNPMGTLSAGTKKETNCGASSLPPTPHTKICWKKKSCGSRMEDVRYKHGVIRIEPFTARSWSIHRYAEVFSSYFSRCKCFRRFSSVLWLLNGSFVGSDVGFHFDKFPSYFVVGALRQDP